MKNKFLLLSAAILLAISPVLAGNENVTTKSTISAIKTTSSAIKLVDVQEYMNKFDIKIETIVSIEGSENVYAQDIYGKNYIVYVIDGIIVGWDHVDF